MWSMGANQSIEGVAINRALLNLCVVTGQIGRPGAGPLSLTGQPNAMGGRETGGLAHLLPGYRKIVREDHRAEVEAHWGLPAGSISPQLGLPATDLFEALEDGRVKAVWICGTNPAVSMPDAERARAALRNAELVIAQDAYHPTETTALAHVVLPAAQWPEKAGHDGQLRAPHRSSCAPRSTRPARPARTGRSSPPPPRRMGFDGFGWADAAAVYDEFAALTAGRPCDQSGVSHARLGARARSSGRAARADRPGHRAALHRRALPHRVGRADLAPALPGHPADPPDADHPLVLTTGRIASQWHTMTRTGKSRGAGRGRARAVPRAAPRGRARAWLKRRRARARRLPPRRGEAARALRRDAARRAPRSPRSTGARCTRPPAPAASTTSPTARPTPCRASPA